MRECKKKLSDLMFKKCYLNEQRDENGGAVAEKQFVENKINNLFEN